MGRVEPGQGCHGNYITCLLAGHSLGLTRKLLPGSREMSGSGPPTCRGGDRVVGLPDRRCVPDPVRCPPCSRKEGRVCLVSPRAPGARPGWAGLEADPDAAMRTPPRRALLHPQKSLVVLLGAQAQGNPVPLTLRLCHTLCLLTTAAVFAPLAACIQLSVSAVSPHAVCALPSASRLGQYPLGAETGQ